MSAEIEQDINEVALWQRKLARQLFLLSLKHSFPQQGFFPGMKPRTCLEAFLPADPQVTSGQEASHGVTGQVMDPALLLQLSHDGIDERIPCASLRRKKGKSFLWAIQNPWASRERVMLLISDSHV